MAGNPDLIVPVVLAGGAGTRLWPASRLSFPKQFTRFGGRDSLFQQTVSRLADKAFARPIIVIRNDYRFVVTEQMGAIGHLPEAVLVEPEPRNTAPAILAAALTIARRNPEALMLVLPSDHSVPDGPAFTASVTAGRAAARAGKLVTFGITPDRPETGYGYLLLSPDRSPDDRATPLLGYVEKPDREQAQALLAEGRCLWNSGMFLFRVRDIIQAYRDHRPDMLDPVQDSLTARIRDLGFTRLAAEPWARVADISIDYAIMEKADNVAVLPFQGRWSDLGNWDAVWRDNVGDAPEGVALLGDATAIECSDSLLYSQTDGTALVGLGLTGIIAVATRDAVLVADKAHSAGVGRAVQALKERGSRQAEAFDREHRPWGWFERLVSGPGFQVKQILVHPGGVLSLQSHQHRAEHWVVVEGAARVTIGTGTRQVEANQSVFVPQGEVHRLENPGAVDMILIEVQTGSYLGEDDITRYEDAYKRP